MASMRLVALRRDHASLSGYALQHWPDRMGFSLILITISGVQTMVFGCAHMRRSSGTYAGDSHSSVMNQSYNTEDHAL